MLEHFGLDRVKIFIWCYYLRARLDWPSYKNLVSTKTYVFARTIDFCDHNLINGLVHEPLRVTISSFGQYRDGSGYDRIVLRLKPSVFCFLGCSALGTWVFSIAGALLAIPVGIKRKSLGPLVFFGTTGTMLDIIMGINACEREHAERQMKLLEAQNAAAEDSFSETTADSWCLLQGIYSFLCNNLLGFAFFLLFRATQHDWDCIPTNSERCAFWMIDSDIELMSKSLGGVFWNPCWVAANKMTVQYKFDFVSHEVGSIISSQIRKCRRNRKFWVRQIRLICLLTMRKSLINPTVWGRSWLRAQWGRIQAWNVLASTCEIISWAARIQTVHSPIDGHRVLRLLNVSALPLPSFGVTVGILQAVYGSPL